MRLCYVRFGNIPASGRSTNFLTGQIEAGVSVYEAIERGGQYSILVPERTENVLVSLSGVIRRPLYEVGGVKVGTGSDGEPLLGSIRIIKLAAKGEPRP